MATPNDHLEDDVGRPSRLIESVKFAVKNRRRLSLYFDPANAGRARGRAPDHPIYRMTFASLRPPAARAFSFDPLSFVFPGIACRAIPLAGMRTETTGRSGQFFTKRNID